jgi:hypothetical protein
MVYIVLNSLFPFQKIIYDYESRGLLLPHKHSIGYKSGRNTGKIRSSHYQWHIRNIWQIVMLKNLLDRDLKNLSGKQLASESLLIPMEAVIIRMKWSTWCWIHACYPFTTKSIRIITTESAYYCSTHIQLGIILEIKRED